jgi:hypothetical protein
MKVFAISEDLANAVLNYLAGKPFNEVHLFVKGFQELPTVEQYIGSIKNSSEPVMRPE